MTEQPQHMQALSKANKVRKQFVADKEYIRCLPTDEGLAAVADYLESRQPMPKNATVTDLLEMVQRFGEHRSRRVMVRLGVSEGKPICELTDRQIGLFCEELRPEVLEEAAA